MFLSIIVFCVNNKETTYRDHPIFFVAHLGYAYSLTKRFRLGILLNTDITYFLDQIELSNTLGDVAVYHKRYFFTTQFTLSYQLFGNKTKKP